MFDKLRIALFAGALATAGVAAVACSGTPATQGGTSAPQSVPQQHADITSPTSGLKVGATIAAATLGDQGAASNVQIAFGAAAGTTSATTQIVSVTLVDAATGGVVDTLTPSGGRVWNGNGYVAWNEKVTPGGDLKASYDLSSPGWSKIEGDTGSGSRSSYSRAYRLHVTLRIDGVEVTLESTDLNRQPQAVT